MAKAYIKSKVKLEAKGIDRMRGVAKERENVKAEVKRNGKGETTLGLSAAEGIERARERAESKMGGAWERPSNHKNILTVTVNIYVTAGNWPTLIVRICSFSVFYIKYILTST